MDIIDLKFTQGQDGVFDLSIADNGDLETVDGYDTAIQMSIFCERRASADQVPTPYLRRGWIGNETGEIADFEIGSLLWLYEQARLTSETVNGVEVAANDGLAWLLEDNLVQAIQSSIGIRGVGIDLEIEFLTANGPVETRNFKLWQNTGN